MLEYDNSAFYYFSITLLVIYLIPGTWYAVAEFIRAFIGSGEVGAKARTSVEEEKAKKLRSATTGWGRLKNPVYLTNLILLVVCWAVFLYLVNLVKNDGEVSTFDPFTILGIEQGATASEIKKAYRSLSLMYHPDKNKGNKKAEEIFMKVAKAYEALTDETAKENYEKYGNPDGKQALEVSIGLPRILLDNPKVVLILYLIAMVIVIPVAVGLWYANSKQYGENNVKNRTYQIIYTLLQENNRVKHMPEIVAASDECQSICKPQSANKECISLLYSKLKNDKLMVKPRYEAEVILHGNLLLHAHVLQLRSMLNESLRNDLDKMLMKSPEIVEGIIAIAYHRKWLDTTFAAIQFSQCLIQGLWCTNDPLEQLPHITTNEVKAIKASKEYKSFTDFLQLSDAERPGLSNLTEKQRDDINKASKLFPLLKVTTRYFVEEDDEMSINKDDRQGDSASNQPLEHVYEKDLVTIRVHMNRENVKEGKRVSPVYAPKFPKTMIESWWLILVEKPKESKGKPLSSSSSEAIIHNIEKVSDQTKLFHFDLKFMAPEQPGPFHLELQVVSDSYMGVDQVIPLSFNILPASELPEYTPHPEDLELDNEPTLFEQMMAANADEDSSDDEEEKESSATTVTVTSKKVKDVKLNSKSVIYEDDDDEEDD